MFDTAKLVCPAALRIHSEHMEHTFPQHTVHVYMHVSVPPQQPSCLLLPDMRVHFYWLEPHSRD